MQLIGLKMLDPVLPNPTLPPATEPEPVTVAVHLVAVPAGTEVGSQLRTVCVAAGCTLTGLKFAVTVPSRFTVAVVEAEDGSATAIADVSLTLQPEKAYPELAVAEMGIVEPGA